MRATAIVIALFLVTLVIGLSFVATMARADHDDHGDHDDNEADWVAVLRGKFEAPVPRETRAHGIAMFAMNDDGTLSFTLIVRRISNVVAAHIHCGAPGIAGPVGVTLFHGEPGGGPFRGVLASGTISTPDDGNKCSWTSLADVAAAVAAGNAYVNVHTNDGVDPANTGPGDFPGGEIRGQLRIEDSDSESD
jgi:CHRD domain